MNDVPEKSTFASLYSGQAPWDIGKPQKAFLDIAEQMAGSILDAGCGTGDNALCFASRGHKVTGIDFLEEPIRRAKLKAVERSLSVTFLVKDATTLKGWSEQFDNAIDCGLFHVFSDDDRKKYVDGLASVLKPGGKLFLVCFSDEEPGTQGPRRVSRKEIEIAFAQREQFADFFFDLEVQRLFQVFHGDHAHIEQHLAEHLLGFALVLQSLLEAVLIQKAARDQQIAEHDATRRAACDRNCAVLNFDKARPFRRLNTKQARGVAAA